MAANWWNSRQNRQPQNALVLNGGFRLDVVSTAFSAAFGSIDPVTPKSGRATTATCEIGSCDHSEPRLHRWRPLVSVQFFTNWQVTPFTPMGTRRFLLLGA